MYIKTIQLKYCSNIICKDEKSGWRLWIQCSIFRHFAWISVIQYKGQAVIIETRKTDTSI